MSSSKSRYDSSTVMTKTLEDGRTIRYLQPRILPIPATMSPYGRVQVRQQERLDQVSARIFGDPLQYHRLCDANGAVNPFTLVQDVGSILIVPQATPE